MTRTLHSLLNSSIYLFINGIQSSLVYRWNYVLRCLFNGISLLVSYVLWTAIYRDQALVAGYTLATMLTYYVVLAIVEAATTPVMDDFKIAGEIRNGELNHILLKPLSYWLYRFNLYLAERAAFLIAAIIPFSIIVVLLNQSADVHLSSVHIWPGILAVIGSACLQFSITYCLALLSFWLLDVSAAIFIIASLEFLAGGHVFPLDLLPKQFYEIIMMLPFAYEYYFPVAALCGNLHGSSFWTGFLYQTGWTFFFIGLGSLIWRQGLRKYTAVGG